MLLSVPLLLLSASLSPAVARVTLRRQTTTTTATAGSKSTCTSPVVRQEWSSASLETRKAYTDAVLCLATKASRIGLDTTLYDDFAYIHAHLDTTIHFVAAFLPWHRYYIHIYEQALQECGYTGNLMYWDWASAASSGNVSAAAIWDSTTGIGGNGDRTIEDGLSRCLVDGPFKSLHPNYRGTNDFWHCLGRDFNDGSTEVGDMLGQYYTLEKVRNITTSEVEYDGFRQALENGPHGAVHSGIGGDMSPSTSPNDPVFFLHHTQIDRLWWQWQQGAENRTADFSGFRYQTSKTAPTTELAQLSNLLELMGMGDDLPVSDVMSTETDLLCYRYEL